MGAHAVTPPTKGRETKSTLVIIAKSKPSQDIFGNMFIEKVTSQKFGSLGWASHIPLKPKRWKKNKKKTVLHQASLSLTTTLIKHYNQVIEAKRTWNIQTNKTVNYWLLKSVQPAHTRETLWQTWKKIMKEAENEARQLITSLRENRDSKLRRKWERSTH